VAYAETNGDGEFSFPNVPPGDYLLNIQFPGLPMDPKSFINYTIDGSMVRQRIEVGALGVPGAGIVVVPIEETGFYRKYFSSLHIYPNPANDVLFVEFEKLQNSNLELRIVNLTGQTIQSLPLSEGIDKRMEVDLSSFSQGVYLLNIVDLNTSSQAVAVYRIMIQR